jgi:ATP-dependent Clp protease ATP-binding subunit ClpC
LNIEVVISEAVRDHLADVGFDENYGARPLRRAIQNEVEDQMAEEYLEGNIHKGETVYLDMISGKIQFHS